MPYAVYTGWGLLIPAGLSLLYGFTSHRARAVLGYTRKNTIWTWVREILPPLLLFTLWGSIDFPQPVLYILSFFHKVSNLTGAELSRVKGFFIVNFSHLVAIALHMILIGACSLAVGTPMNELLRDPFWRIATISAVFVVYDLVHRQKSCCVKMFVSPRTNRTAICLCNKKEEAWDVGESPPLNQTPDWTRWTSSEKTCRQMGN